MCIDQRMTMGYFNKSSDPMLLWIIPCYFVTAPEYNGTVDTTISHLSNAAVYDPSQTIRSATVQGLETGRWQAVGQSTWPSAGDRVPAEADYRQLWWTAETQSLGEGCYSARTNTVSRHKTRFVTNLEAASLLLQLNSFQLQLKTRAHWRGLMKCAAVLRFQNHSTTIHAAH